MHIDTDVVTGYVRDRDGEVRTVIIISSKNTVGTGAGYSTRRRNIQGACTIVGGVNAAPADARDIVDRNYEVVAARTIAGKNTITTTRYVAGRPDPQRTCTVITRFNSMVAATYVNSRDRKVTAGGRIQRTNTLDTAGYGAGTVNRQRAGAIVFGINTIGTT